MPAPIVSYWAGGPLDYIALSAVTSWVQQGHDVTLWHHNACPLILPSGVIPRDAAILLDPAAVREVDQHLIPDRIRWEALAHQPGAIYVPIDHFLLSALELPEDGFLLARESTDYVAPGPIALPQDSEELSFLRDLANDPTPIPPWMEAGDQRALHDAEEPVPAGHLPWGLLGATALTHILQKTGRLENTQDAEVFFPVAFRDRGKLLKRKQLIEGVVTAKSLGLPLYREALLSDIARELNGLPRFWCPLAEALRKTEVEPRAHLPRNIVLPDSDNRWRPKSGAPSLLPTPDMIPRARKPDERICILTCMKNEGPFILEWVAHHRAIGFTDFIVYTNDCTDGTDELLDLLVEKGLITARRDNPWRTEEASTAGDPQRAAMWHAENDPLMSEMDWIMPMDVDEYLTIHVGKGHLDDLFAARPDATMISAPWRLFGNNDLKRFEDSFVTERMTRAAPVDVKTPYMSWGFKTLLLNDGVWGKLSVHRPRNPDPHREDEVRWYAGSGARMPESFLRTGWRVMDEQRGHELVTLNHYSVRDAESYLVKRDRGRVNHIDQDQGLAYWFRMNHNVVSDTRIERRKTETRAAFDAMMADEQIASAHRHCVTAHKAKIEELHARPDHAALYSAVTGPVLERLSKLAPHISNKMFTAGPQALHPGFVDWVKEWDEQTPLPDALDQMLPLPSFEADADRLLPNDAPIRFSDNVEQSPLANARAPGEANEEAVAPMTPPRPPIPRRSDERICILTCMKNEGPFIVDWVAHHRAIGVTDFIVYTNDCTDGTDQLLDLLVEKGLVTARYDNPFQPDTPGMSNPQFTAFEDAEKRPEMAQMDWLLPMDVDEFIDVKVGDGTLGALMDAVPYADTISLTWRLFGNDDCATFRDVPVTDRMHRAALPNCRKPYQALGFKTLYRNDGRWKTINVHRPRDPDPMREHELWWVSSSGSQMLPEFRDKGWRISRPHAGYDLVSLNHYAVRDAESYLVKRDRGRVNHVSEDQGLKYWFRMNHNVMRERTFASRTGSVQTARQELLADPQIAAAHQACVAAHQAKIKELHRRPDMAALYTRLTSPLMTNLSRLTPLFGNRIFMPGPDALADDIVDWVQNWDRKQPVPKAFVNPVPREDFVDEAPDTPAVKEPKPTRKGAILTGAASEAAFAGLLARVQPRQGVLTPPETPPPSENIVVITGMKNEAPFILEWIAWHLAIGVKHFLVYTNDCTDPTTRILDRLAEMGHVTHLDNPFKRDAGQKPQRGALNDAAKQKVVRESDWYLTIDCDEFVTLHGGLTTLQELVARSNHPDIISMTWRFFGNGGVHEYDDQPVTRQFVRCAPEYLPRPRLGWGFKSMVRANAPTSKIGVHRPLDLQPDADIRWTNGAGRVMPHEVIENRGIWFSRKNSIGYDLVTLNHYILRSAESFLVKRERGRINHVDQDQGLHYWSRRNYCTEHDSRAADFFDAHVAPVLSELMRDEQLAALHDEAVRWHKNRIALLKAHPDYASLYEAITDPSLDDALFLAAQKSEDAEK
ncbi:glycosyltransferase family 2 protein [Pontivivens insulae]|uniref:Glycosyl transferase family 2 n=1 Tax=Pontivivens insulae TaxID=1639689 RepID=A0A2R8A7V3_9RHOB|nr:glycosyltransferase family 2 protein [Pontivivens insulae]RED18421.1 glycosyl transferase family 2 [Pontivivens insulae]SPF28319.1 hypothetical protein POI8812_00617 [Pontivivens insulae]